jgi:hypothetical protein
LREATGGDERVKVQVVLVGGRVEVNLDNVHVQRHGGTGALATDIVGGDTWV